MEHFSALKMRMAHGLIPAVLAVCCAHGAWAQDFARPYKQQWKRDAITASGAALFFAGGYLVARQVKPLTLGELGTLDEFEVPGFDRLAMRHWSPNSATVSDGLLIGSAVLPFAMLAHSRARKDWLVLGAMYIETIGFTGGLVELTKAATQRARPYAYHDLAPMDKRQSRDARMSFFSGHVAGSAALCFLTARVFSDYSDNRAAKSVVWAGAALLPVAVGAMRFDAGMHFPTDLIAGYFVGAAIGYLVPELHRRKYMPPGMSMGLRGGPGAGVQLGLSYVPQ